MTPVLPALRIAWRLAPWLLAAVLALLWWRAPQAGSSSAPGQTVTVAGEAALTKPARKWKKRPPAQCEPGPGDAGARFKVVTRDPPAEELERLARQYGFLFGDRQFSADLAGMGIPVPTAPVAGATPQLRIARMLGEYAAPTLRYGGTFGAGLLENGELEARFDPSPAPKLGFPLVWGVGGFYDGTFGKAAKQRHHRIYGLLEPLQTKQLYWRIEGGAQQILDAALQSKWDPYIGVGAEWRSEPWIKKNRRGLRAVKLPD